MLAQLLTPKRWVAPSHLSCWKNKSRRGWRSCVNKGYITEEESDRRTKATSLSDAPSSKKLPKSCLVAVSVSPQNSGAWYSCSTLSCLDESVVSGRIADVDASPYTTGAGSKGSGSVFVFPSVELLFSGLIRFCFGMNTSKSNFRKDEAARFRFLIRCSLRPIFEALFDHQLRG